MSDIEKILDISTEDLKKAAPTFQQQSTALADAARALKESLDTLGSPWGDDEQGQKFGDVYAPKQETIERAVGILVLGLESINVAMTDMADGHIANEQLIEGMFTKIRTSDSGGRSTQ